MDNNTPEVLVFPYISNSYGVVFPVHLVFPLGGTLFWICRDVSTKW